MKYITVKIIIESEETNGSTAIGRITAMMKKLPDGSYVTLKTKSKYVYDIISEGKPWIWEKTGWVTEFNKSVIHQKKAWMDFVENYTRFSDFTIELF